MYEDLIYKLRELPHLLFVQLGKHEDVVYQAADAIEKLLGQNDTAYSKGWENGEKAAESRTPRWIPFESRPMDDEEREYYSEMTGFDMSDDAVMYCSKLPEDGQEVLVCNKYGSVWQDIFCNDPDYGVGFETHGDMDGLVAWMPMPEPYKPEEET